MHQTHKDYLRSSLFGIQDALTSTGGAVVGIAIGSHDQKIIMLAGVVIVLVEAISMAASEFVSNETIHQIDKKDLDNVYVSSFIMFVSYFVAGFIPVLPYLLFPLPQSIYLSIILSLLGLCALGVAKGIISKTSLYRNSLEVMVIGGVAAIMGFLVGYIFKI